MPKFHSSKSTKPLVPEDEPKSTTPDLAKPSKKSVTVAKPANEVHWITKPSSAMEKVDDSKADTPSPDISETPSPDWD